MVEINWHKDYQGEFICPKCEQKKLVLRGFFKGERLFYCSQCQYKILSSINLNRRSFYLESRLKDEHIDWNKDYQGEFVCSECGTLGMSVRGISKSNKKRQFYCHICKKVQQESCDISIQAVNDPINHGVTWYTNHQIKDFICPQCQAQNIYFIGIEGNKKYFKCRSCQAKQCDSICLTRRNLSHYSKNSLTVKRFNWFDDQWDLRTLNPNFDERDKNYYIANFSNIAPEWFQDEVKKYIHYLCKTDISLGTTTDALSSLRYFSRYLVREHISTFDEINRSLILDYLAKEQKVTKSKLGVLRKFFIVGTIKGWFNIDQDIIRDSDYPKRNQSNPDPMSDLVRTQIEQNLHRLPDPIARMWLIGYFSAMRPSEIALLKRDCLVQEGQHWKLVWHRKKNNDYHEIPISRKIAEVVQQQQEYIQQLWGDEWDYLFCHYHNMSRINLSHFKLEPVKKVLPSDYNHPLLIGIRTLIEALDIRDSNGQLAKFQSKLLRTTRLTQLFEQGHDLAVVSAWAGHKHFAITSTHYTAVSCDLMEREAGHIHQALVNSNGHRLAYESFPKSFWDNTTAHKLELSGTHINSPIYGYCGLPLNQDCHKFRACYTCQCFVATIDKLPQYIKTRDELRAKEAKATSMGQDVLVEQFSKQADQLDKIIASLLFEVT